MHLYAGAVSTRRTIQRCWARSTASVSTSSFLLLFAAVLGQLLDRLHVDSCPLRRCQSQLVGQLSVTAQQVRYLQSLDCHLFDIPLVEWLRSREFHPRRHLRIGALTSDMMARKMTGFNIDQLKRLYRHFGLRQHCISHGEIDVLVGTGNFRRGREC